jgi:site-specific DNA-methyltransferase (adenine-specific)
MAKSKEIDIKLSDLIPDDKNFNKGSEYGNGLIEKSFTKFGAGRSILIDKNNRIIAGNKSVENAMSIGLDDVQIVESDGKRIIAVKRMDIDLDTPQGREMALADNASAKANIVFDAELIEAELGEATAVEWGIEVADKLEAEEDDFDVPDGGLDTDIVLGDLFEIGQHRLLCGDSTQTDTFAKLFGEQLADLVVTDPPYNVALGMETKEQAKARNRRTDGLVIKNDKMTDDDFYQFLYDFYTALGSYTKLGGAWYVWHADSEVVNFRKAMTDAGLMVKQGLIWEKSSLVMGRQDYQWQHEPCLYGWKEGAAHGWYSDRKQTTILKFDKPSRNGEHPTMKPIPLFAYQIGNSSKQGDIVADGFGGSGTTMVACHQMNRKGYLVEFDPKYCQVILDRMIKLDPSLEIKKNGVKYEHTTEA